ncbi:ABC transporter substrate-binding protein [Clostridium botulinum]|uniref:ABC transporter substrate-binding protein n=1 Tax=Clostridium botulinum TaxID=1491 RepID=UPI000774C03C|nr:ABC transporter substrate-binding protein [Clostridium botulinum]NFL86538.1 ABC transporter substrate-binding protein [Clostridium botulinum]NFO21499.1 ABC transporter substrate-binding protein [Clostridium botulinum]
MLNKRRGILLIFVLLIICILNGCSSNISSGKASSKEIPNLKNENLVVYVAFNEDEAKVLLDGFKEKTGCNYTFLRYPTEELADKIKSQETLGEADIFLGGTADAVELLKMNDCLEKYTINSSNEIPIEYMDSDGYWIGLYVEALSIAINEDRWEKEFNDIEKPKTLEELVNPKFKGEIVLADPRTSGTGYTLLSYLVQTMGKDDALEFFKKLKNNVGQFTDSGFTPAKKVGMGEYLLTVNFINQQLIVKNSGFNIESIVPDNTGWTICPIAKIKDGKNKKASEAFMNYCVTKEAGISLKDFSMGFSTIPGVNYPNIEKDFTSYKLSKEYDFKKAAKDRKELLEDLEEIM